MNYYKQLDEGLKRYEEHKPYKTLSIDYISNRIEWCYKFHHITEAQTEELCNRVVEVLKIWDGNLYNPNSRL